MNMSLVEETFKADGLLAKLFPGYEPRKGQIEMSKAVAKAYEEKSTLLVEAPTGCHAAGQEILMFDGTIKLVEDIKIGDRLMGGDGAPRTVLSLARGNQEMFDIVPIKGETWRVNRDHILSLVRLGNPIGRRRDCKAGKIKDVSVNDYLTWSWSQKYLYKLIRAEVFAFDNQSSILPISPYHLGILLGDGSMKYGSIAITTADPEIKLAAYELSANFGLRIRVSNKLGNKASSLYIARQIRFGGRARNLLITELRNLGLFGKGSSNKFIPHLYKTASKADRLQLLAGLIDTDGSLSNKCFDYISKSEQLAKDVAFISRSVGFAAYIKPCRKRCQTGAVGNYFRVTISGPGNSIPTRVPRKQCPARNQIKNVLHTGFKIVSTNECLPYYGFSIDGDGRYLLGDFTITHNTGKSVAYLVPAIEAAQTGKVTLIVTANIALQEQLIGKDLPTLKKVIDKPFSYALAKGVNNYICENAIDSKPKLYTAAEKDEWHTVMEWAKTTKTGDLSELPFELSYAVRQASTVSFANCLGKNCPERGNCFYYAARSAWQSASIIVTNYSMFFVDLKIRQMSDDGHGILPDYDAVIFDEVHRAPAIAREFFGFRHTEAGILAIAKATPNDKISADLKASAVVFFDQLKKYYNSSSYRARIRVENCVREGSKLAGLLMMAADSFTAEANNQNINEIKYKLRLRARSAKKAADDILAAMMLDSQYSVYFIEQTGRSISLSSKLVSAALVMKRFFGDKPIILTSATLANGKGDFSHIKRELGISECRELVVESPFDFSRSMMVIPDMPDPNSSSYTKAVATAVETAIKSANGRTLGLFTSWKALNSTYDHLKNLKLPFTILKQGDAPRIVLVEKFKSDIHSVLLGTESFWAGVDVPGEALSCVVIDKLPFISPDDPVLDFFQDKLGDACFQMIQIPNAIIAMKQGVGRLIRTKTDKGVVVALDNRLLSKSYGKQFLRALPRGMQFSDSISSIGPFLVV